MASPLTQQLHHHPPSRGNKLGYYRTSIACVQCRKRKIRCKLSPGRQAESCLNCSRKNRPCVFLTVDKAVPNEIGSSSSSTSENRGKRGLLCRETRTEPAGSISTILPAEMNSSPSAIVRPASPGQGGNLDRSFDAFRQPDDYSTTFPMAPSHTTQDIPEEDAFLAHSVLWASFHDDNNTQPPQIRGDDYYYYAWPAPPQEDGTALRYDDFLWPVDELPRNDYRLDGQTYPTPLGTLMGACAWNAG